MGGDKVWGKTHGKYAFHGSCLRRADSMRLFALGLALAFSSACTGTIESNGAAAGTEAPEPYKAKIPGGDDFVCTDPETSSASPSLMLSKTQLANTLEDLFGAGALEAASADLGRLSDETFDDVTHARTSSLENSKVGAYPGIARAVAHYVVTDDARTKVVFGDCALGADTTGCIDTFVGGFGQRILRRPLTAREQEFVGLLAGQAAPFRDNAEAVLTYVLQSPHFLWRIELGEAADDSEDDTGFALTPYEVATRIAFDVTDSTPDTDLLAAASADQLREPSDIEAQVRRLLDTARGRTKVINNLAHWSMTETPKDLSTLPAALTDGVDTAGLTDAMVDEARRFIDDEVFTKQATFKALLSSTDSFAEHPGLAAVYGHAPVTSDAPATMAGRRAGLLLRSPSLTWTGPRTSIIHRGVDFQLRVLCNEIPQPNVDIVSAREEHALPPEEERLASNRDAVAYLTSSDACQGCHGTINPTGFALEAFDSLGRWREEELLLDESGEPIGTAAIDTTASIPLPDGTKLDVTGAADLVQYVADSADGNACFARNLFRFVAERVETRADDCRIQSVHESLMSDEPLVDVLAALIADQSVLRKTMGVN